MIYEYYSLYSHNHILLDRKIERFYQNRRIASTHYHFRFHFEQQILCFAVICHVHM